MCMRVPGFPGNIGGTDHPAGLRVRFAARARRRGQFDNVTSSRPWTQDAFPFVAFFVIGFMVFNVPVFLSPPRLSLFLSALFFSMLV